MGTVYRAGTLLAKFHFRTFAHWTVEGKEGVPPWGPLIIVSNHLSNADPCFIVASIPRTLHFLAKRSLFSNPLASAFLRAANVHPVSRGEGDLAAIRTCLQLLGRDQPVLFFPEGTRSRGEGHETGKIGGGIHRFPVPRRRFCPWLSQAPRPSRVTGGSHSLYAGSG